MSIAFVTRGIVLLLLTALAGALSSLLLWLSAPAYALRAAIFGAVLGLGVLVTDWLSQERLRKGQYPEPVLVFVFAVLTGLAAGGLLLWHSTAFPQDLRNQDFPPPVWMTGGPLLAVSLVYAILLHGAYAARGLVKRPNLTVLLGAVVAGVACGVLRASLRERAGGLNDEDFVLLVLFGSLPFCLLWMLAVHLADPGWSPQRWARSITAKAEE